MEIHKHPHHVTHKKKFGEYLLEFLMLFLAVFLGFVAENIRENFTEHHREEEFMLSLVNDLKLDTSYANGCVRIIDLRILAIDSTLDYFSAHHTVTTVPLSTIRQMKRSLWDRVFIEHTGTIDQLRNSGGLRLIHNRKIVDSIESYYQQLVRFAILGRQHYIDNQNRAYDLEGKVYNAFDNAKFYQHSKATDDTSRMAINSSYLNEYLNLILHLKSSALNDKKNDMAVTSEATHLIALIKNQYHFENE